MRMVFFESFADLLQGDTLQFADVGWMEARIPCDDHFGIYVLSLGVEVELIVDSAEELSIL